MRFHVFPTCRAVPLFGAACLLGCLPGCSLVTDLDRFERAAAGDADAGPGAGGSDAAAPDEELGCANPRTLCVRLENWPHGNQLTVVDLVSDDNNLRSRAILDPFPKPDMDDPKAAEIVLPLAIPEGEVPAKGEDHPLHLEIWADQTEDGEYTPDSSGLDEVDHDWERDVPANGNFVFKHDTVFKDLEPRPRAIGPDFVMRLRGMEIHEGRMLEVMVIEDGTGRTVGMQRVQSIPAAGGVDVHIPGILDPGNVVYRIEFYADANGNHTYDGLPDDHAWVKFAESSESGIDFEFSHSGDFTELDYQFDFEE